MVPGIQRKAFVLPWPAALARFCLSLRTHLPVLSGGPFPVIPALVTIGPAPARFIVYLNVELHVGPVEAQRILLLIIELYSSSQNLNIYFFAAIMVVVVGGKGRGGDLAGYDTETVACHDQKNITLGQG